MDSPYLGMIQYFAFNFTPKGYLQCAGQLLNINQNAALFSLLGVTYGGDGRTTFALPDTRGRSIIGQGQQWTMGEKVGAEKATLLTANMPVHTHSAALTLPSFSTTRGAGDATEPNGAVYSSVDAETMYSATPDNNAFLGAPTVVVGAGGSGVPFSTMNPYLALNCCICNIGIFPSRN